MSACFRVRVGLVLICAALLTIPTYGQSSRSIDAKAAAIKGADEAAIASLVDEIFLGAGVDPEVAIATESTKTRLIRAELAFQTGKSKGVADTRVVYAANRLAARFNLPAYAYTSCFEVRKLRFRLLTLAPHLMGRQLRGSRATANIRQVEMSPVEAIYLLNMLIKQKLYNPEYQLTRKEVMATWAEVHTKPANKTYLSAQANPRTSEMFAAIHVAAKNLSLRDALDLGDSCLTMLGIE